MSIFRIFPSRKPSAMVSRIAAAKSLTMTGDSTSRVINDHRSLKVKIAQIAPLMESVPPRLYGGTERVVSHLCEALVQEGHDVTLFASGDSVTTARLVACTNVAIRLNDAIQDHVPHYMIMLDKLHRSSQLFDILHFHIDAYHMPLFREIGAKTLTTLHGRQDLHDT